MLLRFLSCDADDAPGDGDHSALVGGVAVCDDPGDAGGGDLVVMLLLRLSALLLPLCDCGLSL